MSFEAELCLLKANRIELEVMLLGGGKEPEALVFGAELRCQYGSIRNYLLTEDYASKGINGLPAKFVVTDCVQGINIMPFGDCYAGGSCISQWMLDDKWENPDGQNETFGGKEIITTASHLVCNTWGMFILPVNSGQNTDIGKQLMLLAELDRELLEFLMNPYNSIYTPDDISPRVLDMLDHIINSDLYGGSIFLMAQGGHDIMGPIILASIGHLAPSIGVSDPASLLTGMENMITRTGIKTNADPRNLDAEILRILKADSEWYAGKVANGGFYKWQEEHKMLAAFLAEAVTSAAYAALAYTSMNANTRAHEVQRSEGRPYTVQYEANTGQGASRSAHRNAANRQLYNEMKSNPTLRAELNSRFGYDVMNHMESGRGALRNPSPDWVWHHPPGRPGVVELIPKVQHQLPSLQPILHPGPNGEGGFGLYK